MTSSFLPIADAETTPLSECSGPGRGTRVARRLEKRGVPFVIFTAQTRNEKGVAEWRDAAAIVEKPSPPGVLLSALKPAAAR